MDIYYLGHSSFQIVGKDVSIVTDPFDEKNVGFKFPKVSADIVTVSHQHEDHNKSEQVGGVSMVVSGPGEYEIKRVSVFGIPSFHDDKKGQERGKNTIYVIEIEGIFIAHLGDLGHKLSDSDLEALGSIDVLMIPVGGHYTIDHKVAAEIVRSVEPKVILPMHYQSEGLNPSIFASLEGVDEFVNELGLKKEEMKKLSIKEASLNPDEQVIVLLDRK